MAHYEVMYACGHGSRNEVLFGKEILRESKINWMERNMVCPDCYRKQHKDDAPTVYLDMSIFGYNSGALKINFVGNTFPIKDKLKARGYRFSSDIQRHGDFLGAKAALKGWQLVIATSEEIKANKIDIEKLADEIEWCKTEFGVVPQMPSDIEIFISQNVGKGKTNG